jgi:hypothetical protein
MGAQQPFANEPLAGERARVDGLLLANLLRRNRKRAR